MFIVDIAHRSKLTCIIQLPQMRYQKWMQVSSNMATGVPLSYNNVSDDWRVAGLSNFRGSILRAIFSVGQILSLCFYRSSFKVGEVTTLLLYDVFVEKMLKGSQRDDFELP
jgi:hypothetical protein